MDWFLDPGDERRQAARRERELLFDAAAELDAHHIKVGNIPGAPARAPAADRAIRRALRRRREAHRREDRLRVHAVRRERHGRSTPRSRSSAAPAPRTAASRSTRGTCRSSASRPTSCAASRPEYLSWVELSDGQFENMDDPIDEVVNHPQPARRGRVRHPRLHRGVAATTATPGPWGVEVLSEELRNTPMDVIFRRAYETTAAQFTGDPQTELDSEQHRTESRQLDRDRLVWIYHQMLRIREFEERVKRTFLEHPGVIRGHTHLADGAEASIVGSIATLGTRRPVPHDLPLPRLPARARDRSEGDDGRDLRAHGRPLQGHRRLDAPHRRLQRASSARRGSSPPGSRTRPGLPGRPRFARRARSCCASSATAPPSRARSPRRSTSPRCGSSRSCS